jgi:lipopolysaccharide/colanic/teichoic acid biosynthesis glycosyltransferase
MADHGLGARNYRELLEIGLAMGVKPAMEFLGFVDDINTIEDALEVVTKAAHPAGTVVLDPFHIFRGGGSLESITDGVTGVLFREQTSQALVEAIRRLEGLTFNPRELRANAERFSADRFRQSISAMVEKAQSSSNGRTRSAVDPIRPTRQSHPSLSGLGGFLKRCLDISVSLLGLAILGLPILLMALAVRLNSPGPALFSQLRLGLGGMPFTLVKLRTMREDAELGKGPTWAVSNDPRCTPLGGWLRRYGLDELPQLWNILKGEMSLVGPRPERPEFHRIFEAEMPEFARRLEVRAGLTGLAQIRGWRGDTSVEARLRSDIEYIETWSLARDLWILVCTIARLGKSL